MYWYHRYSCIYTHVYVSLSIYNYANISLQDTHHYIATFCIAFKDPTRT